jgi:hypothetical protein
MLQLPVSLLCTYKYIINNFTNGRSNEWNSCVCISVHACSYHRRQQSSATTRHTGLRPHDSPHCVFSNIFPLVSCVVVIFGLNASSLHCMVYFIFDFCQPQGNCHYYTVNLRLLNSFCVKNFLLIRAFKSDFSVTH